jgi:hypothetical protein
VGRWRDAIDRCDGDQRAEFDPRPCRRPIIDDDHNHHRDVTGASSTAHDELTARRIWHYHHIIGDPSTDYPAATARHTRHNDLTAGYVVNDHDTVVWGRLRGRIVGDSGRWFVRSIHSGLSRGRIVRKPSRPCLRGKRSGRRIGLGSQPGERAATSDQGPIYGCSDEPVRDLASERRPGRDTKRVGPRAGSGDRWQRIESPGVPAVVNQSRQTCSQYDRDDRLDGVDWHSRHAGRAPRRHTEPRRQGLQPNGPADRVRVGHVELSAAVEYRRRRALSEPDRRDIRRRLRAIRRGGAFPPAGGSVPFIAAAIGPPSHPPARA